MINESKAIDNRQFKIYIWRQQIGIEHQVHVETMELIDSYNSVDYRTRAIKIDCAIESLKRFIKRDMLNPCYNGHAMMAELILENLTENRKRYL